MKMPDPVGKVVDWDSIGRPYVHWRNKPGAITNLYTEAQLCEALAQQEAAMRQVLDLLGPTAPECSGCEYEWNAAIKALEDALK